MKLKPAAVKTIYFLIIPIIAITSYQSFLMLKIYWALALIAAIIVNILEK